MTWVPVNEPLLTDEDFKPLEEAFRSGWISSAGRYVDEFEYRYNRREMGENARVNDLLANVSGKRLTYKGLIA